jgi:hypothetical protein
MQATLRELALLFGLSDLESLSNLTRRIEQSLPKLPRCHAKSGRSGNDDAHKRGGNRVNQI